MEKWNKRIINNMEKWNKIIDLKSDAASSEVINDRILSDMTIGGANLIILVTAIIIACVGLNLNSTAVVIGAMLISPLMGNILAAGYGMATYDTNFIRKALINMIFQVGFALLTATVYFFISPLTGTTDQLLARTSPTIWDVLVALAGGIAGAIGNTRTEKSNVIPGVAIATALMPPLCTAGYGIAVGNVDFFFGAMYLFFINAFFIALSAFLVFKILGTPLHGNIHEVHFRKQRIILIIMGLLITVPSLYFANKTVQDSLKDRQVQIFLSEKMEFKKTGVVSYSLQDNILRVDLVGDALSDDEIEELQHTLNSYPRLQKVKLSIIQGKESLDLDTVRQLIEKSKEKYDKNVSLMYAKDSSKGDQDSSKGDQDSNRAIIKRLNKEAPILFPEVQLIQGGPLISIEKNTDSSKSEEKNTDSFKSDKFAVEVFVASPLSTSDAERLKNWIQGQVELPVILTVQLINSPDDFYGNGVNAGNKE